MTVTPLISIEAARDQLNLEASVSPAQDGSDDAEIAGYILTATEIINERKGYSAPTTFSEFVSINGQSDDNGYPTCRVTRTPVLSVQSITDRFTGAAVNLGQLDINADAGVLTLRNGFGVIGPLTVNYTAGRASIPTTLQTACRFLVQWMWDTQRGGGDHPAGEQESADGSDGMGMLAQAHATLEMSPETPAPGFA